MNGWRAGALLAACLACGGASPSATKAPPMATPRTLRIVREPGRPALAIVMREGDPSPAFAAFVATSGIAPERGAVVPVALAGLFAARLGGMGDARVAPQAGGVRVVSAARDLAAIAAALMAPVEASADLATVKRKVAALGALPRGAPEASDAAACEGALVAPADASPPTTAELEAWRAAAVTSARVAFGVVGSAPGVHAPALPGGPSVAGASPAPELASYDAPGIVGARESTVALAWRGDLRLLGAARVLGAKDGPLAALLAASDTRAHVRSIAATLGADGACLSVRADVDDSATSSSGAARVAAFAALASHETAAAVAEQDGAPASPSDASDAAEQAAMIALASSRPAGVEAAPRVVVAVDASSASARDLLASALAAATHAWGSPVVESRARVERGQPSAWVLVASPCGTAGETDGDAGASAAFAAAAAGLARTRGVAAEPWTASDGVGLVASAHDASAVADVLARSLLVEPVEGARAAQARLLDAARPGLAALAEAIAPGRPAAVLPTGTPASLLRLSDAAIAARADALRHGPLRVVTLANADASQAELVARHVDRWALREGARACPARAAATAPNPGTYAVETDDGTSEAYVAASVPPEDELEADALADALDGDGGLLAKALGDGLARAYGARTLGPPGSRAMVVHVDAPQSALDAAVAQTRALLDRVRQGAIGADDLARGRKRADDARVVRMRDPRERLVALFRGDAPPKAPTLDRVRAAAAAILRDDALVIVAARPRALAPKRPGP